MAIVYSYPLNDDIKLLDELVGTTKKSISGDIRTVTRNFLLSDLANFFISSGGIQKTITLTTNNTSGPATLNQETGVLNIPEYSGVGGTNLTTSQTNIDFTINSSTGTDAVVPLGNGIYAGATLNDYTTAEKNKLSAITGINTGDQNLQQVTTKGATTNIPILVTTDVNVTLGGILKGLYIDIDTNGQTGIDILRNDAGGTITPFIYRSYDGLDYTTLTSINTLGEFTAPKLIKSGGSATQILVADGSVITAGTNITISGGTISSSGGSSITLSAIGSVPNANAATLTGNVLNLQPASASFGGVVTTGTQTFAGDKNFTGTVNINLSANAFKATSVQGIALETVGGNNNNPIGKFTRQSDLAEIARFDNSGLKLQLETASTIASFDANKNVVSLTTANGYPSLTQLQYVSGVTSSIQGQFSGKQPISINLTSLSGLTYSAPAFVKMTAAGTFTLDTSGGSGVTSVTATSPITSSGGTTPIISTSMTTDRLIGRSSAGTGVMEEIAIGSGLSLSAGVLVNTGGGGGGGGILHATASGTDTYTATVSGVTAYSDGDAYLIRFTNGNTTDATLNINSLGARTLYRNNDGPLIGGDVQSGGEMLCVYNSTLSTFQCIGTSPNSLISYITNADSVTITKGQPVYAFGGVGDRMTVKLAYNTSDATSAQTVGLVLSTSIAANQKGFIIMQGLLDGLSILPTATWADGDPVYLGTTAGTLTKIKQYAPNHLVYLGFVTTASNGSAGRLYVRVQNGYELDELHNVQAQTPANKDTLYYDNTVTPKQWKTASISSILGYTPADNAGVVTLAGGQTITGPKTFTVADSTPIAVNVTGSAIAGLTINSSSNVDGDPPALIVNGGLSYNTTASFFGNPDYITMSITGGDTGISVQAYATGININSSDLGIYSVGSDKGGYFFGDSYGGDFSTNTNGIAIRITHSGTGKTGLLIETTSTSTGFPFKLLTGTTVTTSINKDGYLTCNGITSTSIGSISGVYGSSQNGNGLEAESLNGNAIYAYSENSYGIYARSEFSVPAKFALASGNTSNIVEFYDDTLLRVSISSVGKLTTQSIYNIGAFNDSSNSAGTAGKVLSSTGTGTSWVSASSPTLSAYKLIANNTNSTAVGTEFTFRKWDLVTYGGTIVWNGTAPTTILGQSYSGQQVGNMVSINLSVVYSSAGASNTQVTFTLPSDFPTPVSPTGFTAALDVVAYGTGMIMNATNSTAVTGARNCFLRRNTANTGYEFFLNVSIGVNAKVAMLNLTYQTS